MPSTIEQLLRQAIQQLASTSPSPRLDAEVLLMHITGLARTALITRAPEQLSSNDEQRLHELINRRLHGEPVAYLTGHREFWSLDLRVTPDVLIPRPDTELLVEQALLRIPLEAAWTVADLGTGSGAIALAIATERPHCRVIAIDLSAAALAVAQGNAQHLGIPNVEFRHGEWLLPVAGEQLDMIVSNPPYIAAQDPHLMQGDLRFEPHDALVSGTDGLDAIRRIAAVARQHLKPGGWLLLEHGRGQRAAVRELLSAHEYHSIQHHTDLAGLDRVTVCSMA